MTVLHLSHARGWRGGENQLRLLVENLPEPWRGIVGVPAGSALERRLGDVVPLYTIRNGGIADPVSMFAVRRLVHSGAVRVIHAHDSQSHMTAALASLGTGVRLVVSRRNAFPASGGWKYRRTNRFIAVSQAASMELRKAGVPAGKISVVGDAVDIATLDAAVPERCGVPYHACLVICAAAFSPEKDHATLLAAWRDVERASTDAVLVLAGAGEGEAALRGQVASLDLRRVHFLGWRDDLPALLAGADIVTLASRMEGLGSVLCEAQAAGRPVVATAAGGIPEAVEHGVTGLLVMPGEPAALAGALLDLISDRVRRAEMGASARLRARRLFHPKAIAEAYSAIYRELA